MNVVVLVGRLGKDPDLRYVPSGHAVANFSLAVDGPKVNGEKRTDWFQVVAWRKLAEVVTQYLQKGSRIWVRGRLQTDKWETPDGQKRSTVKIVAEEIRFLDSTKKQDESPAPAEPEPASDEGGDEDVPF